MDESVIITAIDQRNHPTGFRSVHGISMDHNKPEIAGFVTTLRILVGQANLLNSPQNLNVYKCFQT